MRLFAAVLMDETVRQALENMQDELRNNGIRGRYTDPFNMHITVTFIGEYGNPDEILEIMEEITYDPEPLFFEKIEKWNDLLVCILRENTALSTYVNRLRRAFAGHGIPFDKKAFVPHVTLVRKAQGDACIYMPVHIPAIPVDTSVISLMKSERHKDRMVYTETGSVQYGEEEILLTAKDASLILNRSLGTICRLCRNEKIKGAFKEKGKWMIPEKALYEKEGLYDETV